MTKSKKFKKRLLSNDEINFIFSDFEKLFPSFLNKEILHNFISNVKKKLFNEMKYIQIYENLIPNLKKEIENKIMKAIIPPGENVGIIAAQSIGERQTQLTLNSFHQSGLAVTTVISGVPRFLEILNTTKEPKSTVNYFKLTEKNLSIIDIKNTIGSSLKYINWKNLYTEYELVINKEYEPWYPIFEQLYSNDFTFHPHCITFNLNKEILYSYNISMTQVKDALEDKLDDIFIVFSPLHHAKIDIFLDLNTVTDDLKYMSDNFDENIIQNNILFKTFIDDIIIPKLDDIYICGIPRINNFFISKDNSNEYYIETEGNNMTDILTLPYIDIFSVKSNNMWEIYNIFGIEGARKFLIEEFINIVSNDGTFINPSHIYLLVDVMTFYGNIQSISRYGIKKENCSVLTRATFEESLDHFSKAAFFSETENINSVSASVMCGKRSKCGSGINNILINWDNISN
tara:strand:+ start:557 stop:1930 length:1374 start_codon:yes stop_codon:yes gene_type:complete